MCTALNPRSQPMLEITPDKRNSGFALRKCGLEGRSWAGGVDVSLWQLEPLITEQGRRKTATPSLAPPSQSPSHRWRSSYVALWGLGAPAQCDRAWKSLESSRNLPQQCRSAWFPELWPWTKLFRVKVKLFADILVELTHFLHIHILKLCRVFWWLLPGCIVETAGIGWNIHLKIRKNLKYLYAGLPALKHKELFSFYSKSMLLRQSHFKGLKHRAPRVSKDFGVGRQWKKSRLKVLELNLNFIKKVKKILHGK